MHFINDVRTRITCIYIYMHYCVCKHSDCSFLIGKTVETGILRTTISIPYSNHPSHPKMTQKYDALHMRSLKYLNHFSFTSRSKKRNKSLKKSEISQMQVSEKISTRSQTEFRLLKISI